MKNLTSQSVDLFDFIIEGIEAQDKYAKNSGGLSPLDELSPKLRYEKVIEFLGHLAEETVEARRLVPRRSWRKDEIGYLETSTLKEAFCSEMTDILLFFRAVLAYSGITIEEFKEHFYRKMNYNLVRPDHKVNKKVWVFTSADESTEGLGDK